MESLLEEAEDLMQSAHNVKPDAAELESIKLYCASELRKRQALTDSSSILKTLRSQQKAFKSSLESHLEKLGTKCAMLSKADAARLSEGGPAFGLPPMPHFVRLVSANKDSSITPEVIQEAVEALTDADLKEANATDSIAAVRSVLLQNIRRIIRTYSESLRMVTNLQRGLTVYDIPEVLSETADIMASLWANEYAIKNALALKKVEVDPELAEHKLRVESFFIRTGLTAQRITLEEAPYRLVRRVSVRKPKIGIGRLEKMLDEVLGTYAKTGSYKNSEIVRDIHIQLANIAPETKSSVSLCSIKAKNDK